MTTKAKIQQILDALTTAGDADKLARAHAINNRVGARVNSITVSDAFKQIAAIAAAGPRKFFAHHVARKEDGFLLCGPVRAEDAEETAGILSEQIGVECVVVTFEVDENGWPVTGF